jgi:hypothetical protein
VEKGVLDKWYTTVDMPFYRPVEPCLNVPATRLVLFWNLNSDSQREMYVVAHIGTCDSS